MHATLREYLDRQAREGAVRGDAVVTIQAIAGACIELAELIALGSLAGAMGAAIGQGAGGDKQTALDLEANRILLSALFTVPVAVVGSEEEARPVTLRSAAPLAVAIDPLDGSSNTETNAPVGTIFSILPMPHGSDSTDAAFLQPGTHQIAAGFVIYGPQTTLVLTVGAGVAVFVLDRGRGAFVLTRERLRMPDDAREFAINVSNYRHWDESIRLYVDDCIAGVDGAHGVDFNMRWIASMVAEAYRILGRGGIYLYPRDARAGYRNGRLRLVYEGNPVAWLIEQAGGAATDGVDRILDLLPTGLHQRVPLVFGSRDHVQRVAAYCAGHHLARERSPLFGHRGLFRADAGMRLPAGGLPCR